MSKSLIPLLSAAVLGALLSPGSEAAIVTWTGNAPVYLARWYNGTYYETHEFQYALDWQGYCNAHFGAECAAYTYWGSRGNWDTNARPTAGDDVRVPLGATVRVYGYNSIYQGYIPGVAYAGTLTAAGTVRVENQSFLYTDSAYIANLYGMGTLVNNGFVTVDNGGVIFQGTGTTVVNRTTSQNFGGTAKGGHTLKFLGDAPGGGTGVTLYEQSRFINEGTLGGGTVWGFGTYNANTQSIFINTGTLSGAFLASGVRFNNDGIVTLASGTFDASFNGAHTGSFSAAAATTLLFGAFGSSGHDFSSASAISSDGTVHFTGRGRVAGSYRAADTVIGGDVVFTGSVSFLDRVTAQQFGYASFQTTRGVSIGELLLSGGSAFFDTGAPSSANTVTLTSGGLRANPALTIAGLFTWNSGSVVGTVHANGGIEIGGDLRNFYGGTLHNAGTANWNVGNFHNWVGVFDNQIGGTLDLKGDFSVLLGGAGARFDNAGLFVKSAGTGIATLPVAFNNSGKVDVQSGTLRLSGGGSHNGSFSAAAGARIELSGGQTIAGAVATSGRVNVTGGSFSVLAGGSYLNASGNSISGTDFSKHPAGQFTNAGSATFSGTAGIQGSFDNQPGAYFGTSVLVNAGTISNAAGATLSSNGGGTNTGVLDNAGGLYIYGNTSSFSNAGGIRNAGTLHIEGLANTGTITNLAAAEMTAEGNVSNAGRIDNAGGFSNQGSFSNAAAGSIVNTGSWSNNLGRFDNEGSFANGGLILNGGEFFVLAAGRVTGAGLYRQSGGTTRVNGTLEAGGGIFVDGGLLTGTGTVIGNVQVGPQGEWRPGNSPGTMTVVGNALVLGPDYFSPGGLLTIEIADATTYGKLIIDGSLSLENGTRVDLVFLSGFVPADGDSFQWLRANSVADGGARTNVTGLPAGWSSSVALGGGGANVELIYELATQIATSGNVSIAAGEYAMNGPSSSAYLQQLDNAGSFSNRANAYAVIGEIVNRAGATLSNRGFAFVYDYALGAGALRNAGTLRNRAGGELIINGTLDNTGLAINEGTLNSGLLTNAAGGRFENPGLLINYGGIINRGDFIVSGVIDNQMPTLSAIPAISNEGGTFVVQRGGSVAGNGSYQQIHEHSAVTRVDGRLAASDIRIGAGTLTGSGVLAGPVRLGGVAVQPGNSAGVLTIDGSLTAEGSLFYIELAGPTSFDRLAVTGDASLNYSQIIFRLLGNYVPAIGDGYTWLTVGGAASGLGTLDWWVEKDDGAGGFYFWAGPNYSPPGMQIAFSGDRIAFDAAPIPEPETWALLLAGLGVVGFIARRRLRASGGEGAAAATGRLRA